MKRFNLRRLALAVVPLLFVAGLANVVYSREAKKKEPASPTSAFMRLKLTHTAKVLEGLAVEDYGLIAQGAQELVLLSHESNWKVFQSPEYNEHSADFRRTAAALTRHAKEKNLDAAALDYLMMTANCINCHKYVRDEQRPAPK